MLRTSLCCSYLPLPKSFTLCTGWKRLLVVLATLACTVVMTWLQWSRHLQHKRGRWQLFRVLMLPVAHVGICAVWALLYLGLGRYFARSGKCCLLPLNQPWSSTTTFRGLDKHTSPCQALAVMRLHQATRPYGIWCLFGRGHKVKNWNSSLTFPGWWVSTWCSIRS